MNSSTLNLGKNITRTTTWPSLGRICRLITSYFSKDDFIIYLERHTVYHLCAISRLSSWWRYAGLKEEEEEKHCQAHKVERMISRWCWGARGTAILIDCRARSPDLTNWTAMRLPAGHFCSETVSQTGYTLSPCAVLLEKRPPVSEQQVNHRWTSWSGNRVSVKDGGVSTWARCLALTNLNDILHSGKAVFLYS